MNPLYERLFANASLIFHLFLLSLCQDQSSTYPIYLVDRLSLELAY